MPESQIPQPASPLPGAQARGIRLRTSTGSSPVRKPVLSRNRSPLKVKVAFPPGKKSPGGSTRSPKASPRSVPLPATPSPAESLANNTSRLGRSPTRRGSLKDLRFVGKENDSEFEETKFSARALAGLGGMDKSVEISSGDMKITLGACPGGIEIASGIQTEAAQSQQNENAVMEIDQGISEIDIVEGKGRKREGTRVLPQKEGEVEPGTVDGDCLISFRGGREPSNTIDDSACLSQEDFSPIRHSSIRGRLEDISNEALSPVGLEGIPAVCEQEQTPSRSTSGSSAYSFVDKLTFPIGLDELKASKGYVDSDDEPEFTTPPETLDRPQSTRVDACASPLTAASAASSKPRGLGLRLDTSCGSFSSDDPPSATMADSAKSPTVHETASPLRSPAWISPAPTPTRLRPALSLPGRVKEPRSGRSSDGVKSVRFDLGEMIFGAYNGGENAGVQNEPQPSLFSKLQSNDQAIEGAGLRQSHRRASIDDSTGSTDSDAGIQPSKVPDEASHAEVQKHVAYTSEFQKRSADKFEKLMKAITSNLNAGTSKAKKSPNDEGSSQSEPNTSESGASGNTSSAPSGYQTPATSVATSYFTAENANNRGSEASDGSTRTPSWTHSASTISGGSVRSVEAPSLLKSVDKSSTTSGSEASSTSADKDRPVYEFKNGNWWECWGESARTPDGKKRVSRRVEWRGKKWVVLEDLQQNDQPIKPTGLVEGLTAMVKARAKKSAKSTTEPVLEEPLKDPSFQRGRKLERDSKIEKMDGRKQVYVPPPKKAILEHNWRKADNDADHNDRANRIGAEITTDASDKAVFRKSRYAADLNSLEQEQFKSEPYDMHASDHTKGSKARALLQTRYHVVEAQGSQPAKVGYAWKELVEAAPRDSEAAKDAKTASLVEMIESGKLRLVDCSEDTSDTISTVIKLDRGSSADESHETADNEKRIPWPVLLNKYHEQRAKYKAAVPIHRKRESSDLNPAAPDFEVQKPAFETYNNQAENIDPMQVAEMYHRLFFPSMDTFVPPPFLAPPLPIDVFRAMPPNFVHNQHVPRPTPQQPLKPLVTRAPYVPLSNISKSVKVLDDDEAPGRTVNRLEDWFAQLQLSNFTSKFPQTGQKANVVGGGKKKSKKEIGREDAAAIQQKIEFLLLEKREKKRIERKELQRQMVEGSLKLKAMLGVPLPKVEESEDSDSDSTMEDI